MATREQIVTMMQGDEYNELRTLLQIGAAAVPVLLDILQDRTAPVYLRQRATVALGEIGSPTAAAALRASLTDDDPVQRLMAARALVKIAGPAAADALVPLLRDPDPSVSNVAIQSLAKVGNETTLAALEHIKTSSADNFLRIQAEAAIKSVRERNA